MKRKEFNLTLKGVSKAELVSQAKTISEELMKLSFRKASGQLEQAHQIPHIKRNLARVRTALSALGNNAQGAL